MNSSLSDKRILIVDDTLENVELLAEILKGYKRSIALNGEDALSIINNNVRPDLILLDVVMPGMDGFEVCRRLKENEATKEIPVIFITSKSEVEDETRGLELGAVDFIPKPISPAIVLARVKNHIELKIAREKLEAKNEELAERNKYITDSINYAKRIQSAIFQNEEKLAELFPESFCLYFPKDIVSGDFYWFTEIDQLKIFAVVDCTGHGVSGAFMSIIGNTLLNEIINQMKITDPGEILSQLDMRVINELQKKENSNTYDGMDMAIGTFDKRKNLLFISSAYRPVYYFQDSKIFEIQGTRKSIGDVRKSRNFKTHIIKIDKETEIYLFSDGITDQSNPENRKYGSSRLKDTLEKIHKQEMQIQKEILEKDVLNHRATEVQRDDICFMGLRIHKVRKQTLLEYSGALNYTKIISLGEKLKSDLENVVSGKHSKLIFFCVNELMENIFKYSEEIIDIGDTKIRVGKIMVFISDDVIEIETENFVSKPAYENVAGILNYLRTLQQDKLAVLKKNLIKNENAIESKSGGIGFVEIMRRSKKAIEYSQSQIDDQKCLMKLYLKIDLEQLQ